MFWNNQPVFARRTFFILNFLSVYCTKQGAFQTIQHGIPYTWNSSVVNGIFEIDLLLFFKILWWYLQFSNCPKQLFSFPGKCPLYLIWFLFLFLPCIYRIFAWIDHQALRRQRGRGRGLLRGALQREQIKRSWQDKLRRTCQWEKKRTKEREIPEANRRNFFKGNGRSNYIKCCW